MFSYSQIARWLTFPVDPVTIEDWVGNREFLGLDSHDNSKLGEELEMAFQIEKLRELGKGDTGDRDLPIPLLLNGLEVTGVVDQKDFLIVAPVEKKPHELKITYLGSKTEKIKINAGEIKNLELDPTRSLKVQLDKLTWSGAGKSLLVIDSRGRPLKFV